MKRRNFLKTLIGVAVAAYTPVAHAMIRIYRTRNGIVIDCANRPLNEVYDEVKKWTRR